MRTFVAVAFAVAVVLAFNVSPASVAEEPAQKAPQVKQTPAAQAQQQPTQSKTAAKDPNYRFQNGKWFYFLPQTKSWKVWNGTKWTDVQNNETRTFSVEQPADTQFNSNFTGTYQTFDNSYSGYPYTNNRIIGSFGFRGAGAKADGRY